MNFYNENDPYAAQWLRNLAAAGHIVPGRVVERSIKDIEPWEVPVDGQAHFFAGIGVWSWALRLAGWPDGLPVWTGSCPCQPFSQAGRGNGFNDDRHLWPEWFRLIRERRPAIILGEQVAAAGDWFDLVSRDLEGEGYAVGAAHLGAHSVGAPHIRQRLYFVAHAPDARRDGTRQHDGRPSPLPARPVECGSSGELAHALPSGRTERRTGAGDQPTAGGGGAGVVGDTDYAGSQGRRIGRDGSDQRAAGASSLAGFWSDAEWIPCSDGKWRAIEPGSQPLVAGAPSRVGRLRAYGNALNAETAATFILAVMDSLSLSE
jgi:DNA (cytosine-5)-methyltransferase 1